MSLHNNKNSKKTNIFRYNFSKEFAEELLEFSKIHEYDKIKDFKNAWTEWIEKENIKELIEKEIQILIEKGFEGNILDKMFKSARYYYRKKKLINQEEKKRKEYTGFTKELLKNMDNSIIKNVEERKLIPPSELYNEYLKEEKNKHLIMNEIILFEMKINKNICVKNFMNKLKKTFKNRYYELYKNN